MDRDLAKAIQAWFVQHDGDGEFDLGPRASWYSVIGPTAGSAGIVFTTKPASLSAVIQEDAAIHSIGMIGRYGLPDGADLHWIRKVVGQQPLFFLGDMDPVDLMVFAWLRAALGPVGIRYLGVNDTFLEALELSGPDSFSLALAPSERESLGFLKEVLPDLQRTVGVECAVMLERGYKIELEVMISNKEKAAATLRSLMVP